MQGDDHGQVPYTTVYYIHLPTLLRGLALNPLDLTTKDNREMASSRRQSTWVSRLRQWARVFAPMMVLFIIAQQLPHLELTTSTLVDWKWSWGSKQPWTVDWSLLRVTVVLYVVNMVSSVLLYEGILYVMRYLKGSKSTHTIAEKEFDDKTILEKGLNRSSNEG